MLNALIIPLVVCGLLQRNDRPLAPPALVSIAGPKRLRARTAPNPTSSASTQSIEGSAVIPGALSDVWDAYTTTKGITSWMVPHGEIDLRVGGLMRTSYKKDSTLSGPDVIENTILCFDPERMVAMRTTKAPDSFPFKKALANVWTVLYFSAVAPKKTGIVCRMMGFDDTPESKKMRSFFQEGNQYELNELVKFFAKKAGDSPSRPGAQAKKAIVMKIRKADYEDDRAGLQELYNQLEPYLNDPDTAALVRYWRGFAMWRLSMNGFNDKVDAAELDRELSRAIGEFDDALILDPKLTDAKLGKASCLLNQLYIHQADPGYVQSHVRLIFDLLEEARQEDPSNPRYYWVVGPALWNSPANKGHGDTTAIDAYQKGLALCARQTGVDRGNLRPTWGKPELYMALAWSNMNRQKPDLAAAERYATEALKVVPKWHYVRDILLPSIKKAERKG